ncbi:stip1 likey and u-box containing protein 1 [Seiridium cupressi]
MQRNKDPERAMSLKNEGNKAFQAGDYVGAEGLYSKAIIADDTNPALYTNRSLARLKLQLWDSTIADCQACLRLNRDSMKANYYLAQAQIELRNYDEALPTALRAHALCVSQNDKSLPQVTALVLRCKKEKWEHMERIRKRENQGLENEMLELIQREREEMLQTCDSESLKEDVRKEWEEKQSHLEKTFDRARVNEEKKRVVPDWMVDEISFNIFIDPVVTKTGKSYERSSILEHLRRSPTDPLTREPLHPTDLRPNLALKQACEEFLQENGWAADCSQVFEALREGLRGTVQDVPHLLSGVEDQEYPKGSVQLTTPYQAVEDLFSWQDLSGALDYSTLKENHFPPSAFTAPSIRSPETAPPYPTPEPVFRARLSLVKGGVLLCVAVHHSTTDVTGFGALLKIWAAHCRSRSSAEVDFDPSWCDRSLLRGPALETVKLSDTVPDLIHVVERDEMPTTVKSTNKGIIYETRIFYFPQATLQELKMTVNEHLPNLENRVPWVSTGDILTAILWSATIWTDQGSVEVAPDNGDMCAVGIPVNFRSRLNPKLPQDYLGAAFGMTTASVARANLLSASRNTATANVPLNKGSLLSLARIASAIRSSLGHVSEAGIRSALEYTASQPDITSIKLGPRHDGISLVSWADQGVYDLDWGQVLDKCDAVRIPKLGARRNPIVLPRVSGKDGSQPGLEVIVSFDEKTMEKFCQNTLIQQFDFLATLGSV